MPECYERYRTRTGSEQGLRIGYVCEDIANEYEALELTRATASTLLPPSPTPIEQNFSMYLVDVQIEEIHQPDKGWPADGTGDGVFHTVAIYAWRAVCPIFSWDFGNETERITESILDNRENPRTAAKLIDTHNAIELELDEDATGSVRGTDRIAPTGRFHSRWNPAGSFSLAPGNWRKMLPFVGSVNSDWFLGPTDVGFAPGEVLLEGITGKLIDQKNNLFELVYRFNFRPNQDEIIIDGITTENVKGWEYFWVIREKIAGANQLENQIAQTVVSTIYPEKDLNDLYRLDFTKPNALAVAGCPGFEHL